MIFFLILALPLNVDVVLAANNTTNTSSVTTAQIVNAASRVDDFYKTNNRLPNYVTISGEQVTMSQFLYLAATGTSQINKGSTASISVKTISTPTNSVEKLTTGNIQKNEYVTLADSLKNYMDTYGKSPNYLNTSQGIMKFESTVYMFTRILTFYDTNNRLPNYALVYAWNGKNITSNGETSTTDTPVTVTQSQLQTTAYSLQTFIENHNKMPTTVTIAGRDISISQFLQLLAQNLLDIYNDQSSTLTTQNISMAPSPVENIESGTIQKTEYIQLIENLISFTNTNTRLPNYLSTTLGKMRYESVLYLLLKVNSFYNTNGRLPGYVSLTPWTGTTTTSMAADKINRPVYIISDIINNSTIDNTRINAIVSALQDLGIEAYNYREQDNIEILTDSTVTINALIVEICGGACASTINEMGTTWYKNLKGTKKVFLVFTEGATEITGLDWLPRSHDDDFSDPSFTGLANPDQYLLNNGYNYYENYNSSKLSELVQILYQEATS